MNTQDAAYNVVHDYPGGSKCLAPRLDISPVVLNSKVNPNTTTHHLTLGEAERMTLLTDDYRILFAFADVCGFVCMPKPAETEDDVGRALSKFCGEFGDYVREVDADWRDRKITTNERKRLEKELGELISAGTHLQALLAGKVGRG